MPRDLPSGIIRDRYGFRVAVSVGSPPHRLRAEKHFKRGTKISAMTQWQTDAKSALQKKRGQSPVPVAGSLAADFTAYLQQVRAMPTYAQRREHLQLWADALGPDRKRSDITSDDIRRLMNQWRTQAEPLSAATCNKRRSALMHVWSLLDGKDGRNPVRAVPKFSVDDSLPRGRDPHVVDAALLKAPKCRSRACARVMLWTGMRPVELERAKPEDIDLTAGTAIVRTAKGGRVRVVPLTKQAISAWREFASTGCWEEPDNTTLTKKKGLVRRRKQKRLPEAAPLGRWLKHWTGMEDLRVYDLRHSYGTALARGKTRLDVIGSLMGHSTLDLTRRYTLAAVTPDALAATATLGRRRRTA
jgi:integrase